MWLLLYNDYRYGRLRRRSIRPRSGAGKPPRRPRYASGRNTRPFCCSSSTRHPRCASRSVAVPEITSRWSRFGLRYDDARAMLPSVSAPNYFSILSGAPPSLHGIVNNESRSRSDRHAPTVFQSIRDAGLDSGVVGFDWYKELSGGDRLHPGECCEKDDPAEVAGAVSAMIRHAYLPFFTVAHFLSRTTPRTPPAPIKANAISARSKRSTGCLADIPPARPGVSRRAGHHSVRPTA